MKPIKAHKTLTATLFTFILPLNTEAAIIINEIDYDQPGTDNAEFIELYNNGNNTISLDNYTIELINGTNGSSYQTIDLSGFSLGADDYFVICSDTAQVANCDFDFTSSDGWFQNGAPDALALLDEFGIIDSLSYEGLLAPYTEGNMLTVADSNSIITSISRLPSGLDTDDNATDFDLGCITPGSGNIIGSGNCSAPSTVPLPAAAWLFGSGLLGLLAVSRRKS